MDDPITVLVVGVVVTVLGGLMLWMIKGSLSRSRSGSKPLTGVVGFIRSGRLVTCSNAF